MQLKMVKYFYSGIDVRPGNVSEVMPLFGTNSELSENGYDPITIGSLATGLM